MESDNIMITDTQVGQILGISRSSVWRWSRSGLLPPPIHITKSYSRWRIEDIETFLEHHEKKDR